MAGNAIDRLQETAIYHGIWELTKTIAIYNSPAPIKAIPPTISYFHDMIKTIISTNTGMLCITSPSKIWLRLKSGEMTSRENSDKNMINIIDTTLGAQYIKLLTFLSIYLPFF